MTGAGFLHLQLHMASREQLAKCHGFVSMQVFESLFRGVVLH